ncbi:Histidine phosphatase [Aureococcus anophagefferens]|nr:Histidine phosphatase [Aureococcus anophagefferens]
MASYYANTAKGEAGAALDARYAEIKAAQAKQQAHYANWLASGTVNCGALEETAASLGLSLDVATGRISYAPTFQKPDLGAELWYCRHGKTGGNTEPRAYQGYVDEPHNALNAIGKQQAEDAADKLETLGVKPDLVVLSPLSRAAEGRTRERNSQLQRLISRPFSTRAADTGKAFLRRNGSDRVAVETWPSSAEMQFGDWDNMMVKDMPTESICHLFYLAQNAVVKSAGRYVDPASGGAVPGENFVECLARMAGVLKSVQGALAALPSKHGPRPVALLYGHSMAGAALSILTGNGKTVDGESFLGFDGKYIMPNATPVQLL